MILTTLVQFKTLSEKCFLKMRQSVIGCKCIPLHPHVLQLLILTIRTLQMNHITAARLAQLVERRSAEREVVSSNPGRTNIQGLSL